MAFHTEIARREETSCEHGILPIHKTDRRYVIGRESLEAEPGGVEKIATAAYKPDVEILNALGRLGQFRTNRFVSFLTKLSFPGLLSEVKSPDWTSVRQLNWAWRDEAPKVVKHSNANAHRLQSLEWSATQRAEVRANLLFVICK